MPGQTIYLETQVIAHELEEVFPLKLDAATVAAVLAQGVQAGDSVAVVDAAQDYFPCEVVEASEEGLRVRIAARSGSTAGKPRVHLVQGLSNEEAMDTIFRQVSELGISARHAGLRKAPDVGFIETLEQTCDSLADFDAVIVCWEGETLQSMEEAVSRLGLSSRGECDIALVIGPRGGLTDAEMALIGSSNPALATVSLGPAILRVETASLIAPALLISALGGLR